mmetsp:Transcript_5090/g.6452  ORF Transcript_5090/g.6452 Transcript_5090/m.6452 type:complete len:480 (+) Transcript_5090:59-1498(+)
MAKFSQLALALMATVVSGDDLPPILDPTPYTVWDGTSTDGLSRRAAVNVPFTNSSGDDDFVNLWRADLIGDATQRGFSQGELFVNEITELVDVALPDFFLSMVDGLDLSKLPDWLADAIHEALDQVVVPAFYKAMEAVWEREEQYVPPRLKTEMSAIAQGLCAAKAKQNIDCDVDEWTAYIQQVNMLPELIKMTCTMFGSWGASRPDGIDTLLQLRALDFGSSPLANYSMLQVHRPAPDTVVTPVDGQWVSPGGNGDDQGDLIQAFASVGFPGLVGVVTGVSERGIGMSEKVWEVYNTTTGVQRGRYDGEADVLVMRDVLELALDRQSGEDYMRNDVNRTWSVFLGVGDYETQEMDIVGYRAKDFHAYTPETMPAVTTQPYMEDLVYVDKHPQPSTDTTLPTLLAKYYGNMTMDNTRDIVRTHETGDLHIAVYDYGNPTMWVSVGRINAAGDFGPDGHMWKACYRPYLQFDLAQLWAGN